MRIGYLFIFFILAISAQAQINIYVLDKANKTPIANASIFAADLQLSSITNANGRFSLEHRPKTKTIIHITHIGYESLSVELDLSNPLDTSFYMHASDHDIQEVVFAVPIGKLQRDNVLQIERRSIGDINSSAPLNLSDAISSIAGVDQRSTGSGISKPVIRGLSGNRIITFAQGLRIENQQWGDEHGLGVGDIGIEAVEVIKGPASLLYGSDALGGVLYFVDERYCRSNSEEFRFENTSWSNTAGNQSKLAYKWHKSNFKINLFGSQISHQDYRDPENRRIYNTRFNQQNAKITMGYIRKNWVSNLSYSYLKNRYGIAEEDSVFSNSDERTAVLPYQTVSSNVLAWENNIYSGNSRFNLILGYVGNSRKEFEEAIDLPNLHMNLQTSSYNFKWYSPDLQPRLNLIVGSQGMLQFNKNKGEEEIIPDAQTRDLGLFTNINYDVWRLKLQGGMRYDNRVIYVNNDELGFSNINYAIGGMLQLNHWELRANLNTGFRAPHTSELLADGVHEGTNAYIIGNANLKSEAAKQLDLGISKGGEHLTLSLNLFYNDISDYIYLSPLDTQIQNEQAFEYVQNNAVLMGGEVGFHFHPHHIHWLHIESNYAVVIAEDENDQPLALIPSNKWKTTLNAELSNKENWPFKAVFIKHTYSFQQDRTGNFETPTAAYQLIDLGMQWKDLKGRSNSSLELNTGVRNLLNANYIDHLSRLKPLAAPNQGLNIYIEIKYLFKKSKQPEKFMIVPI